MAWIVTGIVVVIMLIASLEAPALWKASKFKELTLFLLLMCGAGVLSVLEALQFPLPNPLEWINTTFEPLNQVIYSVFE
jgi:multisubunit Na+/H+ antiporter MnhB subunit